MLLLSLLCFTVLMAAFALQLRMEAGFEKQLPTRHEYIETFQKYRNELFGANRLTVVVRARNGDIWSEEGLRRLFNVTEALAAMSGGQPRIGELPVDAQCLRHRNHRGGV